MTSMTDFSDLDTGLVGFIMCMLVYSLVFVCVDRTSVVNDNNRGRTSANQDTTHMREDHQWRIAHKPQTLPLFAHCRRVAAAYLAIVFGGCLFVATAYVWLNTENMWTTPFVRTSISGRRIMVLLLSYLQFDFFVEADVLLTLVSKSSPPTLCGRDLITHRFRLIHHTICVVAGRTVLATNVGPVFGLALTQMYGGLAGLRVLDLVQWRQHTVTEPGVIWIVIRYICISGYIVLCPVNQVGHLVHASILLRAKDAPPPWVVWWVVFMSLLLLLHGALIYVSVSQRRTTPLPTPLVYCQTCATYRARSDENIDSGILLTASARCSVNETYKEGMLVNKFEWEERVSRS
jgi:hypothetical protein